MQSYKREVPKNLLERISETETLGKYWKRYLGSVKRKSGDKMRKIILSIVGALKDFETGNKQYLT